MKSKIVDQDLFRRLKEPERSLKAFSQRWKWSDDFFDFLAVGGRSHGGSHPRSSNYCVCATGRVHTLTCCTHIFLQHMTLRRTLRTFLCVLHTCMAQGCLQCACRHRSVISPSPFLMFHPSLLLSSLLFPDGHFETSPDYDLDDLTDFDVHDFLPNFPDLKAQVKRTPPVDELFGYLAKSALNTSYEPKEFDWNTFTDDDATNINDPDHDISDLSKTTLDNSVFTQCLNSLFCTFLIGDFVPQRESKESMQSGNREKAERKRRKRRFFDQCCRVDVKEKSTEQYQELFASDSQRILF